MNVEKESGNGRFGLPVLFAGVKWRDSRTGQIYDRYRSPTDKELHSRQQPLRVIIEIRIGRSARERRRRKERGPLRMLRAGERTTANAPWGSLAASFLVCEGARARMYRIVGGYREVSRGGGGKRRNSGAILYSRRCRRGAWRRKEKRGDRTRELTFWLINGDEGEGVMGFLDYRQRLPDAYLPSLENPSCDSLFHDENTRSDPCFISRYDREFVNFKDLS